MKTIIKIMFAMFIITFFTSCIVVEGHRHMWYRRHHWEGRGHGHYGVNTQPAKNTASVQQTVVKY